MILRINFKDFTSLLFVCLFLSSFTFFVAADEYCPPELCDQEVNEIEETDEYCPPELCDEAVEVVDEVPLLTGNQTRVVEKQPVDRTLYSRLTGAMRDTMYQHVTFDKEIEEVDKWISDGSKNDQVFRNTILPIMKENCSNCHSASSSMTKALQELPLTSYEEIFLFTEPAPADSECLACHGNEALENHIDQDLAAIFVNKESKENSEHAEVPCARCHFTPHALLDNICIKPVSFDGFLDSWSKGSSANCKPLPKPECAACHTDIVDLVSKSVHFIQADHKIKQLAVDDHALKAPECVDCHSGADVHDIVTSTQNNASLNMVEGCGSCHSKSAETYFESYHGKAAILGRSDTANCFDCHGSHEIVLLQDMNSPVHQDNIEATCTNCHENINKNFTNFIAHADYHDVDAQPLLFFVYWVMNALLSAVFIFFGIHTALWFYRSMIERKAKKSAAEVKIDVNEPHVRRFNMSHTIMHLLVISSFLTLALTGMTLKFGDNAMFQWIADAFGGAEVLGLWHRIGAMVTGGYFALHLMQLVILFFKGKITIKGLFKEDYTMIPLSRDLLDVKANILYFVGKGPKPAFGRWTYWEKFDYFAVFWGVSIIGLSGLILWFPELMTRYLPGWAINVAYIVHGEEALLATIFIFIAHFFHTHLRPESAPLDPVVFTQRMPLSKFKEERPQEYQKLVEKGELEGRMLSPPAKWYMALVYLFGFSFVAIGLFLLTAILFSMIF